MGMPKFSGGKKDKPLPSFTKPGGPASAKVKHKAKSFCVSDMDVSSDAGKKIIIYGKTGMGKSTLAGMAPGSVSFCPDKGLDDLDHPYGGTFKIVPGIDTFMDLRDAVQQAQDLVDVGGTAVVDTITYVQGMVSDYVVGNIKKEKGGFAKSITDFGWGKGYEHIYNQMRLLQSDLDKLVESGRNVIVLSQLAQTVKIHPTYGDYWFSHPDLYDKGNAPVIALWVAWASYVFKIDWGSVEIDDGKIGVASEERAIYTKPEFSFEAKSRGSKFEGYPAVTFNAKNDDSLWRIMFDG